ncbi:fluoride efflux transporter FluC [Nonomuraea sp. NPDC050556]|uniref:fluoride efflux transporter FluC n=1 Tax=Nonomuraea sp. NPDC050556 TaxID=3364369 RepID=UPI0037A41CC5
MRTLGVISLGGVLGALLRYGLGLVLPHPWVTWGINVAGCLLIGLLMASAWRSHPLLRPFLGVGVLGGFTTFSTYAVEGLQTGSLLYLGGTLVTALVAAFLGESLGRLLFTRKDPV